MKSMSGILDEYSQKSNKKVQKMKLISILGEICKRINSKLIDDLFCNWNSRPYTIIHLKDLENQIFNYAEEFGLTPVELYKLKEKAFQLKLPLKKPDDWYDNSLSEIKKYRNTLAHPAIPLDFEKFSDDCSFFKNSKYETHVDGVLDLYRIICLKLDA